MQWSKLRSFSAEPQATPTIAEMCGSMHVVVTVNSSTVTHLLATNTWRSRNYQYHREQSSPCTTGSGQWPVRWDNGTLPAYQTRLTASVLVHVPPILISTLSEYFNKLRGHYRHYRQFPDRFAMKNIHQITIVIHQSATHKTYRVFVFQRSLNNESVTLSLEISNGSHSRCSHFMVTFF